jgi:hypothetical protein
VINVNSPTITLSFRSRTVRIQKKSTDVSGPGAYNKLSTVPSSKLIDTFSTRDVFLTLILQVQRLQSKKRRSGEVVSSINYDFKHG